MGVIICNRYTARVYVAIGFSDNSCPFNTGPHIMGWAGLTMAATNLIFADPCRQTVGRLVPRGVRANRTSLSPAGAAG
jgi:hypothetical protein